MINMMKVLFAQSLGFENRINVNMIKVWHKIIKLWLDNKEGITCTLDLDIEMRTMFNTMRVLHTMMKVGRIKMKVIQ
jgi:hypothetical protein